MEGGDPHRSSFNAGETGLGVEEAGHLHRHWRFVAPGERRIWNGPVVGDGRAFFVTHAPPRLARLVALDVHDGSRSWQITLDAPYAGTPVYLDGLLFVRASRLHALDAATGRELWSSEERCLSRMVAIPEALFGTGGAVACAADPSTGAVRWTYQVSYGDEDVVLGTPAYANGRLFFTSSEQGESFCLHADTGEMLWRSRGGAGVFYPVVAEGNAIFANWSGFDVLDLRTGDPLSWSGRGWGEIDAPPAAAYGRMFFGVEATTVCNPDCHEEGGWVRSIRLENGQPDWATTIAPGRRPYFAPPAVANGVVFIAYGAGRYDPRIVALRARSGEVLGSLHPNAEWLGDIVVADSMLLVRASSPKHEAILAYGA